MTIVKRVYTCNGREFETEDDARTYRSLLVRRLNDTTTSGRFDQDAFPIRAKDVVPDVEVVTPEITMTVYRYLRKDYTTMREAEAVREAHELDLVTQGSNVYVRLPITIHEIPLNVSHLSPNHVEIKPKPRQPFQYKTVKRTIT